LREFYAFREVLGAFVLRIVKVKYKQASIGIAWAILQPVLAASLFAVFLGRLAKVPSDGIPYVVFALAGMVMWTFFSGAVSGAMESLIGDQAIVRKVYFPREILPIANILALLVDLVPGLAILTIACLVVGLLPGLTWLALPLPLLLIVLTALAVGVGLSSINVYYRDVRYVLPFVLQLGLFASPVVYPLRIVPAHWRTVYALANPVAAAIDSLRRVTLHQQWPDWPVLFGAMAWALVLLALAYSLFKRLERGFADRL
jgi:lipopolysaccharide transport system permease protein